jgi:putative N6-adenine-specific DNA methylase
VVSEVRYACAATATFGLESVVRDEISALGISGARAEDRWVRFDATPREIARCNLGLRAADRVLVVLSEFPAPDFDALYEGVRAVPWRDIIAARAEVVVHARSAQSKLAAVPSIQSVSKKAVVDALSGRRGTRDSRGGRESRDGRGGRDRPAEPRLQETGPRQDVEIALRADQAVVCLDTSGAGLHRRGYRAEAGEAPLRENLAAALVLLSRWNPSRPFADPLCGSGTIPIEAAMIAANRAPGLARRFAAESGQIVPGPVWEDARGQARAEERRGVEALIVGSDLDGRMVEAAARNARAAGVAGLVRFERAALEGFAPPGEFGALVCNPPYGERLGDAHAAEALYRAMGVLYRRMPTWSLFALSAREDFPRFFGARASRNRKLYNGNIRCWYFQYFGPLPPRG